ncbi:MAG: hypothetical protein KDB63_00925 [Nocardioidaceae bacterium]|nr:hypothetical protein [Nocardioidaceae bacterium]
MDQSFEQLRADVERRSEVQAGLREWVLLLGVALASLAVLWAAQLTAADSAWRRVLEAVSTGLLVAAIFGAVQYRLSGRAANRMQAHYLAAFAEALTVDMRSTVARLSGDYLPTHDFPSGDVPDPRFNAALSRDFRGSPYYWFRGYSARYLAVRLRTGASPSCDVHVLLPDPSSADSFNLRLSYNMRVHQGDASRAEEDLRDSLLEDLYQGLVGLYLSRHSVSSIEVILTRSPSLDRFEVLRDGAWITLFSSNDEAAAFPLSVRFSSGSLLYQLQISECGQIRDSPHVRRFEIGKHVDLYAFFDMFERITGERLDVAKWEYRKNAFLDFEKKFRADGALA